MRDDYRRGGEQGRRDWRDEERWRGRDRDEWDEGRMRSREGGWRGEDAFGDREDWRGQGSPERDEWRRHGYGRAHRGWRGGEDWRSREGGYGGGERGWRGEAEQWGEPGMGGRMDWRYQGYDPYSARGRGGRSETDRMGAMGYGFGMEGTWRDWDRDRPWREGRGMGERGGGFYAGYPEERYYRDEREHRGLGERIKDMFRGRGPKGYMRSDERIREDVNDRLTDHPSIDATDITVHVREGEVTLEGQVDSRYVKRMAEEVAEDVSGVKEVMNHLRIRREQQPGETEGNGRRRAEVSTGTSQVRR